MSVAVHDYSVNESSPRSSHHGCFSNSVLDKIFNCPIPVLYTCRVNYSYIKHKVNEQFNGLFCLGVKLSSTRP